MVDSVSVKNISSEEAKKIIELIDEKKISFEKIMELIDKEKRGDNEMEKDVKNEKKFTDAEAKINIYLKENPGCSYRDAVLNSGLRSSEEINQKKVEYTTLTKDEVLRAKKLIDEVIYSLSLAKKSDSFIEVDQGKLDQAYELVKQVSKTMEILVEKNS